MLRSHVAVSNVLKAINRTNVIDSPGLLSRNHQLFLGLVTAQVHSPEEVSSIAVLNYHPSHPVLLDPGMNCRGRL